MKHLARGRAHAQKSNLCKKSNSEGHIVGPGCEKERSCTLCAHTVPRTVVLDPCIFMSLDLHISNLPLVIFFSAFSSPYVIILFDVNEPEINLVF